MTVHAVDIAGQQLSMPEWERQGDPVWVDVRPNLRRIHVLAGDILAAVGKRRDVGGKGRNESEDVRLATAWLAAHDVTDLVIVDAQRLDPRILLSLTKLAASAGTDLWLLHRPPISDTNHRGITRRTDVDATLTDVPVPAESDADRRPAAAPRPPVPHHDFHVFVAAAQRALAPVDAAVVLADYNGAAERTVRRMASGIDPVASVANALDEVLRACPDDSLLIAQVRGIQTAAWHHDIHVSIDLPCLLNSQERPRTPAGTAGPALLSYRQPYRAITWLLASHHIGLETIRALPIRSASADGATITTADETIDVDPSLRPAVRAQRALRLSRDADPAAPLLPYASKTLAYALTAATKDLGLPSHGRLAERQTLAPRPWLTKLGITIRHLP